MVSGQIDASVVRDHLVHLLAASIGKQILEKIVSDGGRCNDARTSSADVILSRIGQHALNRAADVRGGVQKSPVHVEQVDGKLGYHY